MPQEQTKHEARNYHRTQMKRELIIQKLREQGCRITRQRRILLDIILEEECSCCKEIYYTVELSDHTICRLSGEMWMDVMKSGLKAKGYIQNQDIENVIVSAVEG